MKRTEFIKTCGIVCLSGAALATILESCGTANYVAQTTMEGSKLVLKKSEFIKVNADKRTERKFVLVRSDKFNFPICVFRLGDGIYTALLMECTHKGCELQPHGEYMVCPCHGSEFSNTGVVQNPPAEQNLQSFKTSSDNENIYIHF
jgi:cytochrome b6-f complex iron-sulfur subunit